MFSAIKDGSEALRGLLVSMEAIRQLLDEWVEESSQGQDLTERVAMIEVGYARWTAEAEATLLKADAVYKNARNAEERARTLSKEKAASESDPDRVEGEAEIIEAYRAAGWVQASDVNGSPEEGVPALREAVGPVSGKALALNAKFR